MGSIHFENERLKWHALSWEFHTLPLATQLRWNYASTLKRSSGRRGRKSTHVQLLCNLSVCQVDRHRPAAIVLLYLDPSLHNENCWSACHCLTFLCSGNWQIYVIKTLDTKNLHQMLQADCLIVLNRSLYRSFMLCVYAFLIFNYLIFNNFQYLIALNNWDRFEHNMCECLCWKAFINVILSATMHCALIKMYMDKTNTTWWCMAWDTSVCLL